MNSEMHRSVKTRATRCLGLEIGELELGILEVCELFDRKTLRSDVYSTVQSSTVFDDRLPSGSPGRAVSCDSFVIISAKPLPSWPEPCWWAGIRILSKNSSGGILGLHPDFFRDFFPR